MKFVSWNILQGGGTRADRIIRQLQSWRPDVVGLSEFCGTEPSQRIAAQLKKDGLIHQASTIDSEDLKAYRLILASRFPFVRQESSGVLNTTGRWLHAKLEAPHDIEVIVFGVPTRSSGNKYPFHDAAIQEFASLRDNNAVAFGDTNTGEQGLDEESKFFTKKESNWFSKIRDAGWRDVWRDRNPNAREFTWYSNIGNGFRIDQVFATQSIEPNVIDVKYDWGENGRESRLSDHAAIVFSHSRKPYIESKKQGRKDMRIQIGTLLAEAIKGLGNMAAHFDVGMPLENKDVFEQLSSMRLPRFVPPAYSNTEIEYDDTHLFDLTEKLNSETLRSLYSELAKLHAVQDYFRPISERHSDFYYSLEIPLGTLDRAIRKFIYQHTPSE